MDFPLKKKRIFFFGSLHQSIIVHTGHKGSSGSLVMLMPLSGPIFTMTTLGLGYYLLQSFSLLPSVHPRTKEEERV